MSKSKRRRGGQPGNLNACKHGFYSSEMTPSELCEFWRILISSGTDRAIAALRVKLTSALRADPGNRRVLGDASRLLAKWYCSKYGLSGKDRTAAKNFIRYIISAISEQSYNTNRISLPETPSRIEKQIEAEITPESASSASKRKIKKSAF
jgi:hypothetical protein